MRHTSIFVVLAVAMFATPAVGAPITFTFSGAAPTQIHPTPAPAPPQIVGELAGTFILDDEAQWVTQTLPGVVTGGVLSSPLHTISGTFGQYAFVGTPSLEVVKYLDPIGTDFGISDHWILRSPITFSAGGAPDMFRLNLFVYGFVPEISLTPPRPTPQSGPVLTFLYSVDFNDSSGVIGPLQSVVQVPEPPSWLITAFACAAMAAGRKFLLLKRLRTRQFVEALR